MSLLGINQPVAYEGYVSTVGRPGWYIDGALSAEEFGEHLNLPSTCWHNSKHNVLVRWMSLDLFFIR